MGADVAEARRLVEQVEDARDRVLARTDSLPLDRAYRRPEPGSWCVAEVVEHLVLAESFGLRGLWRVVEDVAAGRGPEPVDRAQAARTIDQIFAETTPRMQAPDMVVPRAEGRPFPYWRGRLAGNRLLLAVLGQTLGAVGLDRIVMPHFLVGPLDGRQRLGFFRWHLERHLAQVERILTAGSTDTPT